MRSDATVSSWPTAVDAPKTIIKKIRFQFHMHMRPQYNNVHRLSFICVMAAKLSCPSDISEPSPGGSLNHKVRVWDVVHFAASSLNLEDCILSYGGSGQRLRCLLSHGCGQNAPKELRSVTISLGPPSTLSKKEHQQ